MQPEDFIAQFSVSRESFEKLKAYHALLLKWQKAINLISPKTIQDSWQRHFIDSAQLAEYIPDSVKTIADLGSGAGFPGLVLAIMRPDLGVHLVESDERKAQFLRTVSRETQAPVMVHNERIEKIESLKPGLVTARALADLGALFEYCEDWAMQNPDLKMLFLKGRNYAEEVAAAREIYDFDIAEHESQTSGESRILFISGLKRR